MKDLPSTKHYAVADETQLIPIIGVSSASNIRFVLGKKAILLRKSGSGRFCY